MGIAFNADEVLQMAVKIEHDGAEFYRKAADLKKDDQSTDFLLALAEMEDGHEKTFAAMRDGLGDDEKADTVFDPLNEVVLYLSAMADSHGGEGSPKAADQLTGKESLGDIINIAIGLEKESILFYLGLKDMVPEHLGKDKIDSIVKEEREHVATLAKKLKEL